MDSEKVKETEKSKEKNGGAESEKKSNKAVDGKLPKKRVHAETAEPNPENPADDQKGAVTSSESIGEKNVESDSKKRRKTD